MTMIQLTLVALLCGAGSADIHAPTASLVLGRINAFVEVDGADVWLAAYFHRPVFQYIELDVQRTITGPVVQGRVLLGIELEDREVPYSRQLDDGTTVFDAAHWAEGAIVLAAARDADVTGVSCAPLLMITGPDSRDGYAALGRREILLQSKGLGNVEVAYHSQKLRGFEELVVLCTESSSVFLLKGY